MFLGSAARLAANTGSAFTPRQWGRLGAGCLLALATSAGLMRLAGVPAEPGFGGSLLAGPSAATAVVVAVAVVAAGLVFGALVAGSVGIEAAMFCACIGLTGMAVRCGPMRPVLQYAQGRGVLVALAVECVLLGAVLWAGWTVLARVARAVGRSAAGQGRDPLAVAVPGEVADATPGQRWSALGVTALVTAVCELVLVQTGDGSQALAGVAIGSFLGVLAGYTFLPLGDGAWYWTAPTAVGAAGFLIALLTHDAGPGGAPHGWGAALARPTPLDDASLGTAMAVLAHWSCRRWAQSEDPADAAEPPPEPTAEPETVIV